MCPFYQDETESILHVLRDCAVVKELWSDTLPSQWHRHLFDIADRNTWLTWCLRRRDQMYGYEFRHWFTVLCRHIWLARNDSIFNNKQWSKQELLARTSSVLFWGMSSPMQPKSYIAPSTAWRPPLVGVVKVNTDGPRNESSGCCTYGRAIRDDHDGFVQGFMFRIGRGSMITAEAWGILWGMKLAWEGGFRHIIVESDCCKVLELIQGVVSDEHPDATVILEIQSILEREWEVELLHCCREANRVADFLARSEEHGIWRWIFL